MTAPIKGRARYRNKKDDLSTNILRVFDPKINSSYVLPSWEGSVSDSQILGDALHRRHDIFEAPGYDNKIIENWDDIVILCGSDRATRDGAKNFEDTAEAMNQEGNEVQSNIKLEE
ncbi:uncharacterized protein LOC125369316 [Ricinus communis]|uniref:uncharacterized protein LOC125369316 n=1 Tax=Ricinus communis TaxID=3988 RepID=UPI00201B1418|nr:uncharacterized protein LOC125369316 [Ricinus communis]